MSTLALACYVQVLGDAARGTPRSVGAQFLAGVRAYPATLLTNFGRGLGAGIGMMLCCVPGLWVYVITGMSVPAVGLSGKGISSIGESLRMARRRFWLVAGVEAVGWGILMAASMLGGGLSSGMQLFGSAGAVAGALINSAVTVMATLPLYALETRLYTAHSRGRRADGSEMSSARRSGRGVRAPPERGDRVHVHAVRWVSLRAVPR